MMKRVLIVDDEISILIAFKRLLKSETIKVDTAETMSEAENCLKTSFYQAAIVDLRLTGVTGEEGLEIIKYIKEYHPQTHVILVTGYGSPKVMERAQAFGAAFYFEKPVSGDTLKTALRSLGIE